MSYTGFGGRHWFSLLKDTDMHLTLETWWIDGNMVALVEVDCDSQTYNFKLRNNEIRDDREAELLREIDANLSPSQPIEVGFDGGTMYLRTGGESVLSVEFQGLEPLKLRLDAVGDM